MMTDTISSGQPLGGGDLVQIVKEDYTFNPKCKEEIKQFHGEFVNSGLGYNVVSILGPQSGGKSTLLNLLFNVNFQVMDESSRQQTTKGLWLAHDQKTKSLIMDVEGSDSKERGEKHINFERKSALFSLAISEVLIINMWANDVGRYHAANYDTLRTVFEIHLKLFYSEDAPKTLLLFILRDHQSTPLENLSNTLRSDMNEMWDKMDKPEALRTTTFNDFFDAEFTSLPNYIYEKDKFTNSVRELSSRFADTSRDDSFYQKKYSKRVPADGFSDYSSRIWETIISERDLDLPSVKEMLARVRCDEIAQSIMAHTKKEFDAYKRTLNDGQIVSDLGMKIQERERMSLDKFKEKGSIYFEPVYLERRDDLLETMDEYFTFLKQLQATNILKKQAAYVEEYFQTELVDPLIAGHPDMWELVGQIYTDTVKSTQSKTEKLLVELNLNESETQDTLARLLKLTTENAQRQVRAATLNIKDAAVKRFELNFKYDENNVPREWGVDDKISDFYSSARKKAMELVQLFEFITLPGIEGRTEPLREPLLKPSQADKLTVSIDESIRVLYNDAISTQRRKASGAPPIWLVLLFVFLGFNEFVAFLQFITSPHNLILVAIVLCVCGSLYALHSLGLMGPAEAIVRSVGTELVKQAEDGLLHLTEKLQEASARRHSGSGENIAMEKKKAE
eukprot:CFRG7772T1